MSDAYNDDQPDCVKSAERVIALTVRWKRQIESKGEWKAYVGLCCQPKERPIALDVTVKEEPKLQEGSSSQPAVLLSTIPN